MNNMIDETLKEKATKNLQAHLDKAVAAAKRNEIALTTNEDLSVENLVALFKNQQDIEGVIGWIINMESRINPSKIVSIPKLSR